ncbi:hypothetical protein [Bacillus chungangensis]|uniref:Uncharacterized protein n=1 Tax=Bacillus chungangensis TaxID=587633 RepID=A0ABT9WML7_9BACI|nr:hypothetical protein [Bacillus chungangensis]MDQ0174393.1 hypothetical protein [Bacillus chungangensis]
MKNIKLLAIVLCVLILSNTAAYQIGKAGSKENSNYRIEYVEDKSGRWELYVELKNGQAISEAPVSDDGTSVLIAPDITPSTTVDISEGLTHITSK